MTSPHEEITVECPSCGTVYEDWYRPSINAALDPQLVADADLMRQATSATCPKCDHVVDLDVLIVEGNVWRQTPESLFRDRIVGRPEDLRAEPPKDGDR